MTDWHALDKKEVLDTLETTEGGLSSSDAKLRLAKYGSNELRELTRVRPISIFLEQFKSVLILILILAAIFSFFIKHFLDFWTILIIVLLNSSIGFFQQ